MSIPVDDIAHAAALLREGGLVAFPTETVYGLGAHARNPDAVARIFAAKGRPADHPLIVHLPAPDHLPRWASNVPPEARRLADAFWPGPLTLVLPRADSVPAVVSGGLPTVALRMPRHPVARALLQALDDGIAAPSANRYGRVSPTRADDVRAELGTAVDFVLDGGDCDVGIESTIVDLCGPVPVLLRPGSVTADQLEAVLGRPVQPPGANAAAAPGRKPSHYAPRARVQVCTAGDADARLRHAIGQGARVGLLGPHPPLPAAAVWLRWTDDAEEQARTLYARLREADRHGLDVLVAVLPEGGGIAAALRDRLLRAAGLGDGKPDAVDAARN